MESAGLQSLTAAGCYKYGVHKRFPTVVSFHDTASSPSMRVYWDAACLSHDPPHEILSGRLVPYFESPDRVRKIKQSLEDNGTFQILQAEDDWPQIREHILAVHSLDYLEYMESIYDEWVIIGGDKVRRVFARHDCLCPHLIADCRVPGDISTQPAPARLRPKCQDHVSFGEARQVLPRDGWFQLR